MYIAFVTPFIEYQRARLGLKMGIENGILVRLRRTPDGRLRIQRTGQYTSTKNSEEFL